MKKSTVPEQAGYVFSECTDKSGNNIISTSECDVACASGFGGLAVATLLMSMGMMMLPPVMVSLPFKVLIFLLADGWNLVVVNLARSFGMEV